MNDEDCGVVEHGRSAASSPLSGRCKTHPRDGGLLFAYLMALSVVSECMGGGDENSGHEPTTQVKLSA